MINLTYCYYHIYLYLNIQSFEIVNYKDYEIVSLDLCKKLKSPVRKNNLKLEFDAFLPEIKLWILVSHITMLEFSVFCFLFTFIPETFQRIISNNIR